MNPPWRGCPLDVREDGVASQRTLCSWYGTQHPSKEKTMTTKSGFFHASFSTAALRSAVLAMALIMQASPARSETLDLACVSTGAGDSFLFPNPNIRLLIDTGRSTVIEISIEGAGQSNPLAATISDQFIRYSGPLPGNSDYSLVGTLDRVAGTLGRTIKIPTGGGAGQNYACRRATQKF